MPMYALRCTQCGHTFEELTTMLKYMNDEEYLYTHYSR